MSGEDAARKAEDGGDKAVEGLAAQLEGAAVSGEGAKQKTLEEATSEKDKMAQLLELQKQLLGIKGLTTPGEHKFWSTQPVPQSSSGGGEGADEDDETKVGPLEVKTVDEVRQTPYALPKGFEWCSLDVDDEEVVKEAYTLLTENYVEDDDNMFRFDYAPEFLNWALKPPGYRIDWHVGVRQSSNKKLLAMITGVPAKVHAHDKVVKMAEINFLCVHKKLRSKRLAPVLIKEVTRRVNLTDQWQAVYTAGVRIPKPIGVARYWHRSLNPKKLIGVGFSRLGDRMTMARTIKLYKLPAEAQSGTIPMEPKHVADVTKLLREHQKQFKVWIEFDEEEVAHWLLPRDNVIYSYVITDSNGKVTDFCSFYNLPSSILGHDDYDHLKAAYSFYNVAHTVSFKQLMRDALIHANANSFDVFNALDLMENSTILKDLLFGIGDGNLHYYFYNYAVGPELKPQDIGIVLL
ncbi:Glycylpeptide N-tetradecanoyltransferase [Hondaea fermentalgiana]|uniref:Glycylpeptide N-tetradecanoyltransferase n=1 Tax=Hondaea fermentalgiana TaxID=2315210 RepID=A0A2R5G1Q1_9STRA|nr:Glycylpeptide N-tetradecanoyltransferase [Hondaea fermentalgiana]|eukprot:GBG24930.1 Glycylpeptide N-tetradecanoyltransferase [Hondaea fermentalgiana]